MVNPLNIRSVDATGEGLIRDTVSNGPNKIARLQRQKRKMIGAVVNDSSESGYSADRESLAMIHPPFVSISLHSEGKSLTRNNSKCPKRRKKNELQYATTTVKNDLARASISHRSVDTMKFKSLDPSLENVSINLKNHVQLLRSKDYLYEKLQNLKPPSSSKTDALWNAQYFNMINAVRQFYPSNGNHIKEFKTLSTARRSKDTWSAPSTSSDVSDTESDQSGSGSDNDNNSNSQTQKIVSFSPLLDDSIVLKSRVKLNDNSNFSPTTGVNDEVVTTIQQMLSSSLSASKTASTLTDMLQISKTARIVVNAYTPLSIVHANAAFYHLLGEQMTDAVTGMSLLSLLKKKSNQFGDKIQFARFILSSIDSSSTENGKKLSLMTPKLEDLKAGNRSNPENCAPFDCAIRLFPILSQPQEVDINGPESVPIGYFAIEFIPESNDSVLLDTQHTQLLPSDRNNLPMGVVA